MRVTNQFLQVIRDQQDTSKDKDNTKGDESNEDQDNQDGSSNDQGDESNEDLDGEGSGQQGEEDQEESSNGGQEDEEDQDGKSGEQGEETETQEEAHKGETSESNESGSSSVQDEIQQMSDEEFEQMLQSLQEQMVDSSKALDNLVDSLMDNEDLQQNVDSWDEEHYRPYSTSHDQIIKVETGGPRKAKKLKDAAKPLCGALKSKLRTKFLMARRPETLHGTKRGDLSSRRLVQSMVQIKGGKMPSRPNQTTIHKDQTTLAVSIVLDESSSMTKRLITGEATASLAIAQALESLDCPVEVIGFRDGEGGFRVPYNESRLYHREGSVNIDVFKGYEEKVAQCAGRFTNVVARGGTPMSDGIHHAMMGMNQRTEAHKVILVLTDGYPNNPGVVLRQIRLAKEAGVAIIGVGLESAGCAGVTAVFRERNILVDNINDLPKALMSCLEDIMFPKRTKKIRLDT